MVGEQIAEHAEPTTLRERCAERGGGIDCVATQLRMVQSQLLAKIAAAVGDGVVTSLKITGPVAPVVAQGQVAHLWRGPRDTLRVSRTTTVG